MRRATRYQIQAETKTRASVRDSKLSVLESLKWTDPLRAGLAIVTVAVARPCGPRRITAIR